MTAFRGIVPGLALFGVVVAASLTPDNAAAIASEEVSPPVALPASDPRMQTGAAIFLDSCAACHNRDGSGVDGLFPRLARNPAVVQEDPASVLRVIIEGARGVATDAAPAARTMPALGWRLSDRQLADVVTYIRNSWGNAAAPVSAGEAAGLRGKIAPAAE
jgi:mono/diheme cytochrome c family protein